MGHFRAFIELLIKEYAVSLDCDTALLRLCGHMDYMDWPLVSSHVVPMAKTDNARKALERVSRYMYHMEEGHCGNL